MQTMFALSGAREYHFTFNKRAAVINRLSSGTLPRLTAKYIFVIEDKSENADSLRYQNSKDVE